MTESQPGSTDAPHSDSDAMPPRSSGGPAHRRRWRPSARQWMVARVIAYSLAVIGLLAVAVAVVSDSRIPENTTVNGVDVGGMNRDEAIDAVRELVAKPAAEPLTFTNDGQTLIVKPRQAGVWVNAEETVEPLLTRQLNLLERFFSSPEAVDISPVIVVEEDKLDRQIGAFQRLVTTSSSEPSLSVRGTKVSFSPGSQGREVDAEAARTAIIASVTKPRTEQELPVQVVEPSVTVANAAAANAWAQAAVSGPVKVAVGLVVTEIPARVIGNALTFTAEGGDYVPSLDGAVLYSAIDGELQFAEEPQDARFKVGRGGQLRIIPSRAGGGISDDDLATQVLSVLGQDVAAGGVREVVISEGERQPAFTTADAEALGITDKLSSFTQKFQYAAYRVTNIGQAAEYVNGTILMPGETFSMNDTIKERTEENGYTVGTIIGPGGVFEDALGGGVSAATTAVWTAAFFAGMERVDTRAHSVYISRYQPGLEATVAWGIFDMKFRNDSPHPVLITTEMTNSSMTVDFWGTRVYDEIEAEFGPRTSVREPDTIYRKKKDGCSPQSGIPGFAINVDRVFYQGEEEVKRETIRTYYRAAPKVVCGKKPKKDKDSDSDGDRPGNAPEGDADPGTVDEPRGEDEEVFENIPADEVEIA